MKELFHIHTYRCGHAEEIADEVYVKKAIELGAKKITFTDHAPFPGNPFQSRMQYSELPGYVNSIKNLAERYKYDIEVCCGLEIEYLPSFRDYYMELKESGDFDVLLLGQHMYEVEPGKYSFSYPEYKEKEYEGCLNAIVAGIELGIFDIVAHPDRSFRRIKQWDVRCDEVSKTLINCANNHGVMLEKNYSSEKHKYYYWQEFWDLVPECNKIIYGIDAHNVRDLEKYVKEKEEYFNRGTS